jgi:hypothetical protein
VTHTGSIPSQFFTRLFKDVFKRNLHDLLFPPELAPGDLYTGNYAGGGGGGSWGGPPSGGK